MPTFQFNSPEGKTYSVDGPEGSTQEQAFQVLQSKLAAGDSSAPASFNDRFNYGAPQQSLASDIANSAGSGLEQGTAHAIGLPGDMASLAHSVAPQGVTDAIKSVPGASWLYQHLPTSQAVLNTATDPLVDPEYTPQTAAGRYTKAITSSAAPGFITGLGPTAVLGGAAGGQAASDVSGGNPIAAAAGSIAGGFGGPLALARLARRPVQELNDAAAVKAAANAGYRDPALTSTFLTPDATRSIAQNMSDELRNSGTPFMPAQSPRVHAAINALADSNAPNGAGAARPVSIADLHSFRKTLGEIGSETADFRPTEQARAATVAKNVLDRYLDNVPAAHVTSSGDPDVAVGALRSANANWRAQKGAQTFQNLIDNAVDSNDTKNSALNLGNILRQTFLPLLKNDAAKLRPMVAPQVLPQVTNAVRQVTQGDGIANSLRYASNLLGGGGGLGSALVGSGIGGVEGYHEHGVLGGVAGSFLGALPGQTLRLLSNARTLRAAQQAQKLMLEQAPANASIVAANRAATAINTAQRNNALDQGVRNALLRLYVSPNRDK